MGSLPLEEDPETLYTTVIYDVDAKNKVNITLEEYIDEGYQAALPNIYMYTVMFFIGSFSNYFLLWQLFKTPKYHTKMNYLIRHMTLADLFVVNINIPFEIIWRIKQNWTYGEVICRISQFFRVFGLYLTSMIVICVSLDRYYAVVHPLSILTVRKRNRILLACSYVIAIICSIPNSIVFHVDYHPHVIGYAQCWSKYYFESKSTEMAYNLGSITIMYLLPLIVIIVCYAFILHTIDPRDGNHKDSIDQTGHSLKSGGSPKANSRPVSRKVKRKNLANRKNQGNNKIFIPSIEVNEYLLVGAGDGTNNIREQIELISISDQSKVEVEPTSKESDAKVNERVEGDDGYQVQLENSSGRQHFKSKDKQNPCFSDKGKHEKSRIVTASVELLYQRRRKKGRREVEEDSIREEGQREDGSEVEHEMDNEKMRKGINIHTSLNEEEDEDDVKVTAGGCRRRSNDEWKSSEKKEVQTKENSRDEDEEKDNNNSKRSHHGHQISKADKDDDGKNVISDDEEKHKEKVNGHEDDVKVSLGTPSSALIDERKEISRITNGRQNIDDGENDGRKRVGGGGRGGEEGKRSGHGHGDEEEEKIRSSRKPNYEQCQKITEVKGEKGGERNEEREKMKTKDNPKSKYSAADDASCDLLPSAARAEQHPKGAQKKRFVTNGRRDKGNVSNSSNNGVQMSMTDDTTRTNVPLTPSRLSPLEMSQNRASENRSKILTRARKKTMRTSLAIVITFILCWTPYSIVTLIKLLYPRPPDNLSNPYVEPMLLTLALLNSCINPFVHSYHIFFDYFKSLKKERKGNPNESPTVLGRSRSVRETHV